ncbi:sag-related sequence srs53c [Cystoisospora suis]|uniref:Sag-related sequence srs53c n=1 Tax=Cystoisospora suis TaxID=483139 RepID=A0A2C6KQC1_9APIC|nr:sag-related sequence srs53c [Cystoisospora suis]
MLPRLSKSYHGLVGAQAARACATLVFVCVVVGPSSASAGQENMCSAGGTIPVTVNVTSKTVSFTCASAVSHLLPAKKGSASNFDQCYDDKACTTAKNSSVVVGTDVGLVVTGPANSETNKKYTVTVQKLPTEAKTVFFLCSENETPTTVPDAPEDKKCTVELTIPAKPPADTCAEDKETIAVEVDPTHKSVTFNCGGDLKMVQPADSTKVYKDDCATEVTLEEELPSAKVTKDNLKNTLELTELPKAEKTLCYKCVDTVEKSSSSKQCSVKVKVPSSGGEGVASRASASILAVIVLAFMYLQ